MDRVLRKTNDLVFERRAVTCADSLDHSLIHRGKLNIVANDLRGFFGRIDLMTRHVVTARMGKGGELFSAPAAEFLFLPLRLLELHAGKIDGFRQDAGRSPGFEASDPEPELSGKRGRKRVGREIACPPSREITHSVMQFAVQERTGCNDDRPAWNPVSKLAFYAGDSAVFDQESGHFGLKDIEIRRLLKQQLHGALVDDFIALGTRRPDRRPLGPVQHAELD